MTLITEFGSNLRVNEHFSKLKVAPTFIGSDLSILNQTFGFSINRNHFVRGPETERDLICRCYNRQCDKGLILE